MPPPPSAFSDAAILTGPTGSGKSAIAMELAERIGGELLAMDSMTLYRGLDIGTAKPSPEDQARVPHHLLDLLDPWEAGNVADWLGRAAEACAGIRSRGRKPIFVGGTPFYLKALLYGLFDGPPSDPVIRAKWEAEAERLGPTALHALLAEVDAKSAERLHENDRRRVVRALEVWELTGQPLSSFQQTWDTPGFGNQSVPRPTIPCVLLDRPREELYRRIDARVVAMLNAGWLDEVRRLLTLPRPLSREASQALGYRELLEYVQQLPTPNADLWDEVVIRIQTRTRQFAKRQLTWFRHLPECVPIAANSPAVLDQIEAVLRGVGISDVAAIPHPGTE